MVQIKEARFGRGIGVIPTSPNVAGPYIGNQGDLCVILGPCSPAESARILAEIAEECIASDARQKIADEARTAGQPR